MSILFNGYLAERELGNVAVRVDDLKRWAGEQRITLPAMLPSLDGHEAIQIEALLNAICLGARQAMEDDEAMAFAETLPLEPRALTWVREVPSHARYQIGRHVSMKWRKVLEEALQRDALPVVDAKTGLPIDMRTLQQSPAPSPALENRPDEPRTPAMSDTPDKYYKVDLSNGRSGSSTRWTDEACEEMKAYRAEHGTKKTAEKFGISESRVRYLLPSGKPAPQGYSAFNPRPRKA